jgi:hypothetical protein
VVDSVTQRHDDRAFCEHTKPEVTDEEAMFMSNPENGEQTVEAAATLAAAPEGWNDINGEVNGDGTWTRGGVTRHKTNPGDIVLDLRNNVDGGLYVQLVSLRNGAVFGNRHWGPGEYGPKCVSEDVRAGTVFRVDAKKGATGPNNDWGGRIYY